MIKKILIVDDSNMMRSIIKNFIQKSEIENEVIEASDGDEAIAKYNSEKPDLVFMDIMMPKVDGITAAKKIKESDSSAKIIMCTSVKEKVQDEEAQEIGVLGYITKPFNSEQIIGEVKKHLS